MSREIVLTRGMVAVVDDADYLELSSITWRAKKEPCGTWYAQGTVRVDGKNKVVLMHRLLCDGQQVDHKNTNGLDNRRDNLRPANASTNGANRKLSPRNTSGVKGVTWNARSRKWQAQIGSSSDTSGSRMRYLGVFDSLDSAAAAYDAAAVNAFGKFARTNEMIRQDRVQR